MTEEMVEEEIREDLWTHAMIETDEGLLFRLLPVDDPLLHLEGMSEIDEMVGQIGTMVAGTKAMIERGHCLLFEGTVANQGMTGLDRMIETGLQ